MSCAKVWVPSALGHVEPCDLLPSAASVEYGACPCEISSQFFYWQRSSLLVMKWAGNRSEQYEREYVWIYSNPIYIGMPY